MPHSFRRSLFVAFLLLAFVPRASAAPHTFTLDTSDWHDQPHTVHLAGTFNGWSTTATPMHRNEDNGRFYHATLDLPDGITLYKFVIDGQRWINDPAHSDAVLEEPDGHGGMNSAVLIGFDARKADPPKPNHINTDLIRFDPAADVNVICDQAMVITLRTRADDVQAVEARVKTAPDSEPHTIPLHRVESKLGWDRFSGMLTTPTGQIGYTLVLRDGNAEHTLGDDAALAQLHTPFHTPDWAKDAVWYQIFAERFRNGDPSNDPGDAEFETLLPWTSDWWKAHTRFGEAPGDENFYTGEGNVWRRRYGGDIQGVREALPYLRELGVNAIYFNPVFEADSMHKYDASDYRHIDDNFGVKGDLPIADETDAPETWQWSASDKVFLDFIEEAHRQGFKVILDGVFNHVGRSHPFFQDVLAKGPDSRYADWFEITDWGSPENWRQFDDPFEVHGKPGGIQWRAWDSDNGHLPVFKKDPHLGLAPGPREHIFHITRRWLAPEGEPSKGVDGWRLDVPGDIPHPFWIDWRNVVKDAKADAYITGEIWHFAQPWLQGDQFDAVMNYEFAKAAQDFFVDQSTAIPPSEFARRLTDIAYAYPLQVSLVQQNLFDSHDTDRLASMFVNPDHPYDGENRIQDNGPGYNPRKPTELEWRRMMQAVACQMTYLGAPMIYYGSEAGMWSPDDPSNRMPMLWRELMPYDDPQVQFHAPLFAHYQRLIAIRQALPALRRGFFHVIQTHDEPGVLVYARDLDDQQVIVVLNRSAEPRPVRLPVAAADGATLVDLMNDRNADVLQLPNGDPEARPAIRLRDDAKTIRVEDGKVAVRVPAYGTVILTDAEALP